MGLKTRIAVLATHYGLRHQLEKLQEELRELDEAIDEQKQFHVPHTKAHIIEELADVYVVARQIMHLMNVRTSQVSDIVDFKVERQLWRIENEKTK